MGDNLIIQRKSINHLPELKKLSILLGCSMYTIFFDPKDAPKHKKNNSIFYVVLVSDTHV